jgi:hypothetical protein
MRPLLHVEISCSRQESDQQKFVFTAPHHYQMTKYVAPPSHAAKPCIQATLDTHAPRVTPATTYRPHPTPVITTERLGTRSFRQYKEEKAHAPHSYPDKTLSLTHLQSLLAQGGDCRRLWDTV